MLTTFLRTLILYLLVLIAVRCMGKTGLSSADPFQIVMMLMISEIATIPIESPDVPLLNGVAAISMIIFIYSLSSFLSSKSERLKLIINGKPSVLIANGAINFKELKKSNITVTDLTEMLRLKNAPVITDVYYAYLETNGELSIILKPEKEPVTRQDINISAEIKSMPCILISDGTIYEDNLKTATVTHDELMLIIKKKSLGTLKDILLCFCDEKSDIHFYVKSDKAYIKPKHVVKSSVSKLAES